MAWTLLKAEVDSLLPTNGINLITAQTHRSLEYEMIDKLGSLQFKGIAVATTDPGPYDGERFYIAVQPGTYSNFDNIVVAANELVFLVSDGSSWTKHFVVVGGSGGSGFFKSFDNVVGDSIDMSSYSELPDPSLVTEDSINASIFVFSGSANMFFKNVPKSSLTKYQYRINFASETFEFKDNLGGKDIKVKAYNYYENI